MKHVIPNNPVLLAVLLGKIQAGDDKHQQDKPLPKEVRAELDTAKSERAKVHLARMKAQLDRANERRAALAARIARKEAEVASAPEVTPPESQSTHPTPSTGTT